MDFLEIRKKARERAAARAAAEHAPPAPGAAPGAAPVAAPAPGAPPSAGELAGRLQALPDPDPARFTTWRPGEPPPVPIDTSALPAPRGPEPAPAAPALPQPAPAEARALAPRPPADPLDAFFYRPDEEAPDLPEMGWEGTAGAAGPLEPGHVRLEEYLTFALGGEEYAVPVDRVQEVLRPPPVTEVPRAPPHVLGVVTVRGRVVAVIDPRARLGLPAPPDPHEDAWRLVIVDAGDGPCGLRVDAIASVVRLPAGSLEPCPQGIGGDAADCLLGIGRERERLFTVIEPGALLRRTLGSARRAEGGPGGGA